VIAQCGESYHNNLERVKEGKEEIKLAVNWKRAGKENHSITAQPIDESIIGHGFQQIFLMK
jgi:hypothetical protein